jgi:hypothetical protein
MKLVTFFKNLFRSKPKSALDFIKYFKKTSKIRYAHLQLIYKGNIILRVDCLRYTTIWFKRINIDVNTYKNGYVIYINEENTELFTQSFDEFYENNGTDFVFFRDGKKNILCHFLKHNVKYVEMASKINSIVRTVYSFKEENPDIFFNILYSEKNRNELKKDLGT